MNGPTQSATAVVCRTRFTPPCPSSASMYWAVIASPFVTETSPSADGETEVVRAQRPARAWVGAAIKRDPKVMAPEREREILLRNYRAVLEGEDQVAGRPAWVLSLKPLVSGKPSQTLLVDRETSVILENKRFRARGSFAVHSRFTAFEPRPDLDGALFRAEPDREAVEHGLDPAFFRPDELRAELEEHVPSPETLPGGFVLESTDLYEIRGSLVRHLRYTDGLSVLSVFATDRPVRAPRRSSPTETRPGAFRLSSSGKVFRWRSGDRHFTLIGDVPGRFLGPISTRIR